MFCITKLIHHCCQRTCSLENAFRNFQQRSFERKHDIVLKSYSPEYNQKAKLKKKKAQIAFPLKCMLLLQTFRKLVVHLKDFLFSCSPHSAAIFYTYLYIECVFIASSVVMQVLANTPSFHCCAKKRVHTLFLSKQ